jgi:type IV pilus assembly protein PilW
MKTRIQQNYTMLIGRQSGFNLIELMLSVVLGSVLILAAAFAFQEAKRTYLINDNVARLQEQAHFVLDILDEDIRHSNFWGRHNKLGAVTRHANAQVAITGDCADRANNPAGTSPYVGWALDVEEDISATNGVAAQTPAWGAGCFDASRYVAMTDTITIRHADTQAIATLDDGKVYMASDETPSSLLFITDSSPSLPAGIDADAVTYEMRAHGYYVRDYSFAMSDGIPMLRRMTLVDGGSSPEVQNQEIAIGVEDLQVEFGIDTDDFDNPNRGSINRYVNADNAVLANANTQILSVRIWLLMRSQNEELNYQNTDTYDYAEKTGLNAFTANDSFRRLLVTRTYQVRNMEL